VVMAAFALVRGHAGFVSAKRSLDLRIVQLWWDYTALSGVVILLSVFIGPLLSAA
jgi:cytochrome c oxidase subunit I+III